MINEWSTETKQNFEQYCDRQDKKHRKHQAERDAVKGKDMIFTVEPYEQRTFVKWNDEHSKVCTKKSARSITYCFTQTGIGLATIVKCSCGEEINITDYEIW